MTINVYPDSNVLSRALADLLVDYSWKSFTLLYDTDEGERSLKGLGMSSSATLSSLFAIPT